MKKFAFFLPQFHEIEENNKWWGYGFTEWTNVKNAKSLFKGHKQPAEPLDGYYNLLDKETVLNQTTLANNYKIDGFIYYHYYFEGKKLLEKPAENLLKWKDIKQHFFFCWANHSWYKSVNGKKELLIEQNYGNYNDWEKHFDYLLPFFKDARYEKKDNKPIFMIFNSDFNKKEKIFDFFNQKCIENGFKGIYIINSCKSIDEYKRVSSISTTYSSMYYLREPAYSLKLYKNNFIRKKDKIFKKIFSKYPITYSGNKIIKKSIKKLVKGDLIIHGLFFSWDNTPRHKSNGYIIKRINKKNIFKYLNLISDEEYLFINAWNEWSEGMILEGTKEDKYLYLDWLHDYFVRR